ncbi:MAG: hypothetical protein KF891_05060 [Rhizobacter sp.]|nr:hypothetical protein [Rhizobacter sp.]
MHTLVTRWFGAVALMAMATHAWAGEGLAGQADRQSWEGLKARLALGTRAPARGDVGLSDAELLRIRSISLMGDYYLGRPWLGNAGGWRATSGVLFGSRSSLWSSPALLDRRMSAVGLDAGYESGSTLPYLGVGYTGWSSKGGWGLSADLGLMGPNLRPAVGKAAPGAQSLDDTVRDLRFSPVVQLGLSYTF